ncbi:ricin-type beta-trefoil lectin domain protein [Streptomyces misionensis]|uniref:Ricin-type beta-trefoil lectin domain protein n=1 Tax=Streptomyces misionensis TaxID=67331 RepID=A0A5C6JFZ8_9ACTN|nr:ricin-type beta-trefoil lectin domain protein [Streptomyces misionensis]TWV40337.1 ricin-type beta-trefoil lectin domain protein [Streptomyces misionensis]
MALEPLPERRDPRLLGVAQPLSVGHAPPVRGRGKCLTQVYGAVGFGGCSDSAARWTFRSASGGTVKIVNVSTGACLSSSMKGQNAAVADCGSISSAILWHTGSGNTLSTAFDGGCLALSFGGNVSTQTCRPGTAAQNWART